MMTVLKIETKLPKPPITTCSANPLPGIAMARWRRAFWTLNVRCLESARCRERRRWKEESEDGLAPKSARERALVELPPPGRNIDACTVGQRAAKATRTARNRDFMVNAVLKT